MNEYQYLRALAYDRFEAEYREMARWVRGEIDRIRLETSDNLLLQQVELEILEEKRKLLTSQLLMERMRAEDIIHWLMMDTQLREDGLNYPDQYEQNTILRYVPINRRNCA